MLRIIAAYYLMLCVTLTLSVSVLWELLLILAVSDSVDDTTSVISLSWAWLQILCVIVTMICGYALVWAVNGKSAATWRNLWRL